MYKIKKILLIFTTLLFFLSSCTKDNSLAPIDSTIDKGWYTHQLINSKESCQLPCFGGIQVGETTYDELYPYLSSFAYETYEPIEINDGSYTFSFGFYDSIEDTEFYLGFNMQENVIRLLSTPVIYDDHSYIAISEIMQSYGVPTQVYFEEKYYFGTWDTSITIFYEKINVKFDFYASEQPELENGNIFSCFKGSPAITIWRSEEEITFYDLFTYADKDLAYEDQKKIQNVEDAIGWTLEDFYQYFYQYYDLNEFCVEMKNW